MQSSRHITCTHRTLTLGHYRKFLFQLSQLFAYLVPHVSIEIGAYRQAVAKNKHWSASDDRLKEAYGHIIRSSAAAILTFLTLIVIFATTVALLTRGLDQRMQDIINGMAYYMASAIFLFISRKIPKWTSYYYHTNSKSEKHDNEYLGTSVKVLKFKVYCDIGKQFLRVFFLLLPFYCGANAVVIPTSALLGIVMGFFIDFCIYNCRHYVGRRRLTLTILSTVIVFLAGLAMFLTGTYYIAIVWGLVTKRGRVVVGVVMAIIYTTLAVIMHGAMWYRTKKLKERETDTSRITRSRQGARSFRDRMGTSLLISKIIGKKRLSTRDNSTSKSSSDSVKLASIDAEGAHKSSGNDQNDADGSNSNGADAAVEFDTSNQGEQDAEPPSARFTEEEADKNEAAEENESAKEIEFSPMPLNDIDGQDDEREEPSYRALCCARIRCRRENKNGEDERSRSDKFISRLHVALWVLISLGFLFFVIINIGAQHQANSTFALLGPAQEKLYSGFRDGEVCAFDNRGPASNITTFADKDAAHAAGFQVLHCQPCGECSTWENLRIEWVTRNYLAAESARCAKKSLFGGEDAVTSCLEQPPIEFQSECAQCWTQDILCTKRYCAFIYLQSQLINTVGNFNVKEGTITSAVCEEAHCELEDGPGSGRMGFVECSGATRRRMNIVSSIERPEWQQCLIVDANYTELFGPCCESPRDFYEAAPKWQELDEMGLVWSDVY